MRPRRVPIAAGVLLLLAGAAHAQTVTITNATPGATVEAMWNATPAGTATVDARGIASMPLQQIAGDTTVEARVFVDTCGDIRRVVLVRTDFPLPSPQAGCARQEIAGVFVLRPVSTIVVNASGSAATLRLRQGPFDPTAPIRTVYDTPTGFVLFAGGGLTSVGSDAGVRACGDAPGCARDSRGLGYAAGAAFWFLPFMGVEVALLEAADLTVEGAGPGHRFTSRLDPGTATAAVLLGVPRDRARIYGKVGAAFQRTTFTTTQTIDPEGLMEGAVTVPGGSQTLQSRTEGWGLLFGGGLELWVNRTFGLYVESGRAGLKGSDGGNGDASLDDRVLYIMGGVKLHLGR